MKKEYEFRCPDCNEKIYKGDKFCKNCACKLDWEDEEEIEISKDNTTKRKQKEKSNKNNKYKIPIFKVINLFLLSLILCLSAYIIGNYDLNLFGLILSTLIDFLLYSFIFMIYPSILTILKKGLQQKSDSLKSNCLIGAIILTIIYSVFVIKTFSPFVIGFFCRMLVYSIIYFYINKYLFIKAEYKKENKIIQLLLLFVLAFALVFCSIGYGTRVVIEDDENSIEENNRDNNIPTVSTKCEYKKSDKNVSYVTVSSNSSDPHVAGIFDDTICEGNHFITDTNSGDKFKVNYKLVGDESIYECNETWYNVTLSDGSTGYLWAGYTGMYVNEN